jgi:hypothetical protein
VLAFDATGRALSARQTAQRSSAERVRAALAPSLGDGARAE